MVLVNALWVLAVSYLLLAPLWLLVSINIKILNLSFLSKDPIQSFNV